MTHARNCGCGPCKWKRDVGTWIGGALLCVSTLLALCLRCTGH